MSEAATRAPSEGLQWVRKELATTIVDARNHLQKYSDHPEDVSPLGAVAELLNLAHGALRMVEVYGAALLVEEMRTVAKRLRAGDVSGKDEALEALSRAVVQLPAYLDRVAGGGHDVPLVLLPLLNDLRAVRGSPLLSESSLFVLNVDQGTATPKRVIPANTLDYKILARKIRPHYQKSLLGWLRGQNLDANLKLLGEVVAKLESGAKTTPVFQFWWVLGGVVEAVRHNGLRPSAAVKRLLGQADQQLKALSQSGEEIFQSAPPTSLINSLLYYVALAKCDTEKVAAIKSSFSLSDIMQGGDSGDTDNQAILQGPSVDLMKTVGAAIKQDVSAVKDAIDIFVRTKSEQHQDLKPQCDSLRKLSDTLGVLGLDELRQQVAAEGKRLQAFIADSKTDEEDLLQIASTLIHVEEAIEEQLLGVIIPETKDVGKNQQSASEMAADADRKQVAGAVLRECIVNLTRIKETLSQFIENPERGAILDGIPKLINGICAGLSILEKPRAAEILGQVEWHINSITNTSDISKHTHELDRLADAIVSIEYYMETVRGGRADPWYMLDNAETCLKSIKMQPSATPATVQSADTVHAVVEEPQAVVEHSTESEPSDAQLDATGIREAGTAASSTSRQKLFTGRMPPLDNPLTALHGKRVDPELLELFIEEAKEEVASLRRSLPRWQHDPEDREVLLTIRRSFHTLKGSGRMVGANLIGEYSWGLENLANKVVSQSLLADQRVVQILTDGLEGLPQLIEQLEVGTPPDAALVALIESAWALADEPYTQSLQAAEDRSKQPDDAGGAVTGTQHSVATDNDAGREVDTDDTTYSGTVVSDGPLTDSELTAHQPVISEAALPVDIEAAADETPLGELEDTEATGVVPGVVLEMQPLLPEADGAGRDVHRGAQPAISLDPALHEIFLKESLEHLDTVNQFINEMSDQVAPFAVTEPLHRAWHTLSGSANMAGVAAAAAIASPINHHLRNLRAEGRLLNDEAMHILQQACSVFEEIVRGINKQSVLPEVAGLLEAIDTLPDLGLAALQAAEALEGSGEIDLPAGQEHADYDAEIAAIFAEEAAEILDASDQALSDWFSQPQDSTTHLEELLRHLHTLKGGARMAGIASMGDLSHETESLLERVRDKEQLLTEDCKNAVRLGFDQLHSMTEQLANGQAVSSAHQVMQRIAGIGHSADTSKLSAPASGFGADAPEIEMPVREVTPATPVEVSGESDTAVPDARESADQLMGAEAEEAADDVFAVVDELDAAVTEMESSAMQQAVSVASDADEKPQDKARIDARLLDEMLNNAGEVSIFHSRLEEQVGSISFNLTELHQTVARLREQLRKLEIETEAQILHKHQDHNTREEEFDPLELDRYSGLQQLSRALAESVSDLVSLQHLMTDITRESESLLVQQARVTGELQDALIRSRMLPFERYVPRFERIVRQAANEGGKRATLTVTGGSGELDRQVLQRMLPPFEHMLRNAVFHGIEDQQERQAANKPETGQIGIALIREGAEMVIRVTDDGRGLDADKIRHKAQELGILKAGQQVSDAKALELILGHGFSTAGSITQSAGRGVGMDVVANQVKMLGGSLHLASQKNRNTEIIIRLPLTLAVSQALLVRCGDERYAIPLPAVEGIVRAPVEEIKACLDKPDQAYQHNGYNYTVRHLSPYLGGPPVQIRDIVSPTMPVILIRAGEHSSALLVDELMGSREVVVKSAGPMVSSITGIAGATILGDGSIVVILDVAALIRDETDQRDKDEYVVAESREDLRPIVLVVDDSITVRRVTQRLLERNGMRVLLAKDGVDAVAVMQEQVPDLVLLDIEMPRMDGYEVASHIRNSEALQHVPITMITSRVGEKHRARAFELGVDKYLGKPYQENQLLDVIQPLLTRSVKQRK